jgi:hypothetical protein
VECQSKSSWNILRYSHGVTGETSERDVVKMAAPRNENRNSDLPDAADLIPLNWAVHLAPCACYCIVMKRHAHETHLQRLKRVFAASTQ